MRLATLRPPPAAMSPTQKRRAAWLALWAFLKGTENLVGHLAERVKVRALQPDPPVDADPDPVAPEVSL